MIAVGIDVGKKGGIAFIDVKTLQAEVYKMPEDFTELIALFEEKKKQNTIIVGIEKQQPFPKQGVCSTFRLGTQYGMILGILKALRISYEEIHPKRWQVAILGRHKKKTRKEIKQLSLEKAKALFPQLANEIGKHDGKSDALLIAEYIRRCLIKYE